MSKKILFLVFICTLTLAKAQQQFNCYHVQEFLWNSKTEAYDTPVEKSENTTFKIDVQKTQLVQVFQDETTSTFTIKSQAFDQSKNIQSYSVISPTNGLIYLYKIDFNAYIIEVRVQSNNQDILLKKYLFKV